MDGKFNGCVFDGVSPRSDVVVELHSVTLATVALVTFSDTLSATTEMLTAAVQSRRA